MIYIKTVYKQKRMKWDNCSALEDRKKVNSKGTKLAVLI